MSEDQITTETVSAKLQLGDFINPLSSSDRVGFSLKVYNLIICTLIILLIVLLVLLSNSKLPCISTEDEKEFQKWCKIQDLGLDMMANPRNVANTTILSNGYVRI